MPKSTNVSSSSCLNSFSDEENHESTALGSLPQLANMMPTLNILDEGLICGVAFLLRREFSLFIHEQLLAKEEMTTTLERFVFSTPQCIALSSHCMIEVLLFSDISSFSIDQVKSQFFQANTQLAHFFATH